MMWEKIRDLIYLLKNNKTKNLEKQIRILKNELNKYQNIDNYEPLTNRQFEIAAKCASDLIYRWDIDTDALHWFGNINEILGLKKTEFPRTLNAWFARIHPDDQNKIKKEIDSHRTSSAPIEIEYRIKHENGDWHYWIDRGLIITENNKPKYLIGACSDITENRKKEEELKSSEKFLNDIIDKSPFAMWVSDTNGTLIRSNKALRTALNIKDEQIIGKYNILKDDNLIGQGLLPRIKSIFEDFKPTRFRTYWSGNKISHVNFNGARNLYIDVSMFPIIDNNGKLKNIVCQWADVTKEVESSKKLAENRNELKWLLKSMANAFVIFDSVFNENDEFISYRFVYINDAYERITGVKNSDVNGKTVHEIWPNTESEWVKRYGEVAITGKKQTFELYHDPTKKFYRCTVYRPWNTNKRFCVVFEDITERKRTEELQKKYAEELESEVQKRTEELKDAQDELLRKEKLATVGKIAGIMSHEIRNPLGAINNALYLLNLSLKKYGDENINKNLKMIQKSVNNANETVTNILDFTRAKIPKLEPTNILEVVNLSLSKLNVPETVNSKISIPKNLPNINADSSQIEMIIKNIITNAFEAMNNKGTLSIEAKTDNNKIILSISDTGVGIAKEIKDKIFTPLFSTKNTGIGLGLANCIDTIRSHNGEISFKNNENKGTTFYIELPILK